MLFPVMDLALKDGPSIVGVRSAARRQGVRDEQKGRRRDRHCAKLMETETKMMKNGATPDVITFNETTITEMNTEVLSVIVDESRRDQSPARRTRDAAQGWALLSHWQSEPRPRNQPSRHCWKMQRC